MSDISLKMSLTENVSEKMKKVATETRNAATAITNAGKEIDKAFNSNAPDSFASEAGSAIDEVTGSAENLGSALDDLFDSSMSDSFAREFQDASDGAEEFTDNLNRTDRAMREAEESARGLGESTEDIFDDSDGVEDFRDNVEDAGQSMDDASGKAISLTSALKTLFAAVSAATIIHTVGDFASDAVDLGKDYTAMMSEVAAISGASATEIEQMEATAREYGATTIFSATDAAEALKYMSLAGWDAQQSSDALGGVLSLAAASGMELGQASDMVTDYLSAFGMQASDAAYMADMLAYAQSNSNTTAEQLGEAYQNSAANLNAAGQDIETTTSLLEAMANQGYKGSQAGTSLAAIMRDITNEMENGSIKIGKTSIAVQDSAGNFRDLTDILTDVESATASMGDAQKATALSSTFTADSIKGVNMLLNEGMEAVSGYEEELRKANGTASNMSDIMNDNLTGDIANLNSAYEEMKLQVFENMEEPLRDATQYLTNDVIPALTEWVPSAFGSMAEGLTKVGTALEPVFKTVLKNPDAVGRELTSIAGGFVALKAVNAASGLTEAISGINGITGLIGKLSSALGTTSWGLAAAGVTAAVVAIGAAVDKYNDLKIDASLSEHFGNVSLSDSQIEAVAGKIINAEWLVNVTTALGYFDDAESARLEAEEALKDNDALEWKAKLGISLTEDEQSTYKQNIETFKTNIEQALINQTIAAEMAIETFDIKMADGSSLSSKIEQWANEDLQEMTYLSAGLTNLVEKALEDGIIDVDEQAAIDQLQTKISNIMSGWKEAEAQAEMDMLTQKYGRLSGADLESGSFTSLVTELGEQRETAAEALYESEKEVYATLNSLNQMNEEGIQRISDSDLEFYKEQVAQAARNAETAMLMNSVLFEKNTMEDAYGDLLTGNYSNIETGAQQSVDSLNSLYTQYQNGVATIEDLFTNMENSVSNANSGDGRTFFGLWQYDGDQAALADIYEAMKPDMDALKGVINEYKEVGQAVPQEIMDQFNEAMMLGAAAGDYDAAWQVYANQIVESGNEELVNAIRNEEIAAPQELRDALEIALTETTDEPLTLEGLQADLEEVEVNEDHVNDLIAKAFEGLEYSGETHTVNGQVVAEYEVTAGQTMSEIASNVGIALDELIAVNPQIENPNLIYVGQKINIPADKVEVDASEVGDAVAEQTQAAVEETSSGEASADVEITTDTTVTAGETDVSSVEEATQEELDSMETFETTASADITAEKTGDNIDEVHSQFEDELQGAFNTTTPVKTYASIWVDYQLANPTATINFGGGGTGSASVSASIAGHAEGGYFDSPHIAWIAEGGSGEYVIPIDGSERSKEMWSDAGKMLGVMGDDVPISIAPSMSNNSDGNSDGASHRTIDININGNGKISAGGSVTKADVVEILMQRARDVIVSIVEQEALVGGDAAYEY